MPFEFRRQYFPLRANLNRCKSSTLAQMDFFGSAVRHKRVRKDDGSYSVVDKAKTQNESNLCLYDVPVNEAVSLLEFQELGASRLKVLRGLENAREKNGSDWASFSRAADLIIQGARGLLPTTALNGANVSEARRNDRISHFVLRLACCQTQEHREWFVKQETELFRVRFGLIPTHDRLRLLNDVRGVEELDANHFKVDFERLYDLMSSHKIHIQKGSAIITVNELEYLIVPMFRESLISSMTLACQNIGSLHEERRLLPLMQQMIKNETIYDKGMMDSENISADMIDELVPTSFPPCMVQIHSRLRSDHKIRHFARQQYGLFLKGIGLPMEQALEFLRREFTKVMDNDQFTRDYSYNIRYMYGKEGRRTEGRPLSCPSIILGTAPSKLDCHGCPFRHLELDALSKRLSSLGFPKEQVQQMVDLSKSNRYDKACTRYFEFKHNMPEGGLGSVITHPNEYYSLSRKILRGDRSLDAGIAMEVDIEDAGCQDPNSLEADFYEDG